MRGVNKLILEIRDTESEYFERAILFLKPESLNCSQNELNRNADKLLKAVTEQKKSGRGITLLWVLAGALLISAGTALLLLI